MKISKVELSPNLVEQTVLCGLTLIAATIVICLCNCFKKKSEKKKEEENIPALQSSEEYFGEDFDSFQPTKSPIYDDHSSNHPSWSRSLKIQKKIESEVSSVEEKRALQSDRKNKVAESLKPSPRQKKQDKQGAETEPRHNEEKKSDVVESDTKVGAERMIPHHAPHQISKEGDVKKKKRTHKKETPEKRAPRAHHKMDTPEKKAPKAQKFTAKRQITKRSRRSGAKKGHVRGKGRISPSKKRAPSKKKSDSSVEKEIERRIGEKRKKRAHPDQKQSALPAKNKEKDLASITKQTQLSEPLMISLEVKPFRGAEFPESQRNESLWNTSGDAVPLSTLFGPSPQGNARPEETIGQHNPEIEYY